MKTKQKQWIIAAAMNCIAIYASAAAIEYPKTERIEHTDEYYGVRVPDPYRWLEQDVRQSRQVKDWVTAQNKVTSDYLAGIPKRQAIRNRLEELLNFDRYGRPFKVAGRYYLSIHKNTQNHAVVYQMDSLNGPKKMLFNPNEWSKDGTVALGGMSFSQDGKYVAYAVRESGSDWETWKIRDLKTDKDRPDTLTHLKFTSLAWDANSVGCFYSKYPDPNASEQFTAPNENMKLMYHRLGTAQDKDSVVYYRSDCPDWSYNAAVTDDQRYLIITVWIGTAEKYRVLYKDLQTPDSAPIDLIDRFENEYSFIDNDGPVFFFRTDNNAQNSRVIAIDIRKPQKQHWKEIIPESKEPLTDVDLISDTFICTTLKDVTTQTKLYTMDGRPLSAIVLPGPGTADGFNGRRDDTETFYSFQSMTTPSSIYRFDMTGKHSDLLYQNSPPGIACDEYQTRQVFYPSKDGARIPLFIAHKKGIRLDGSNPTLLYGYGGFNISMQPYFSAFRMAWMEMGGIYAIANIRGGGEYGQTWHQAGMKTNKMKVFDDFVAAAEFLIAEKYTSPQKLAIHGGSNGGLLVGACMTRRPDLFAAAVPAVGVMDMLRFDLFTSGRHWTDEYGSAKDGKDMFDYLKAYSPYHNLKPNVAYPAALIVTADTDDRVVPAHSFKFAAMLQHVQAGPKPVLIRIETRAGHGSGIPMSKKIEEQADIYAFLAETLGIK